MGLLDKVAAVHRDRVQRAQKSWSEPEFWDVDRLRWSFLGSTSLRGEREEPESDFLSYAHAVYKRNGPVAALIFVRMAIFSEARFAFRRRLNGRPGELFGTQELAPLEQPWPGATTPTLLKRMILDADLAGNSFIARLGDRLRRLRPDWVTIVSGSRSEPELHGWALDAEVIGYYYCPPGAKDYLLTPDQVAHFAPIPDPEANWRGMSWITPVLREVSSDNAATLHKKKFFENGATPQVIVSLDASVTPDMARRFIALMNEQHSGVDKAYKTLYLGGGADATVVGRDLQQLDFKNTQGAGETRLAAAAGVPAVIVGFSEGLAGSSLNAGNYGQARRRFGDGTMRPLWRDAAGSLASIIAPPPGAELWYDDRDIAFLREDARDAAEIFDTEAKTVAYLVREGFEAESAKAAVLAQDVSLLRHTGLVSVQLHPPGTTADISPNSSLPPAGGSAPTADPAEEQ